jgi:ligand-binding sensor domain-containing protein
MKNLITLAKKAFKPVAVLKYLFFPFMMAQSQGVTDLAHWQTTANAVAQTGTAVWVGTNNGIIKVSKKTGKIVRITTDNSSLPSNRVTGICVTPDENVYASTDKGIFRFDGVSHMLISTENANLPTDNFTSIASDERGRIFLGTKDKGIVMMENYRCEVFNKGNSELTSNSVTKVYRDENGLIIGQLDNGNLVAMGSTHMILIYDRKSEMNAIANGN